MRDRPFGLIALPARLLDPALAERVTVVLIEAPASSPVRDARQRAIDEGDAPAALPALPELRRMVRTRFVVRDERRAVEQMTELVQRHGSAY